MRFMYWLANCLVYDDRRGRFGQQANKPNGNGGLNQPKGTGSQNSSPTGPYPPAMPPLTTTASFTSTGGSETNSPQVESQVQDVEPTKFFFREKYARLGVKGNFMPLAAQPKNVDLGEWLAHQCMYSIPREDACSRILTYKGMEQYRLVSALLACIQEVDANTGRAICNPVCCPTMSAGRSHTYTWLNNEKVPIKVPAHQYISLVQRWIVGKLSDVKAFPIDNITGAGMSSTYASGGLNTTHSNTPIAMPATTLNAPLSTLAGRDWIGKNAGFPEGLLQDVKTCFRQIFRLYAHLYHSHWIDPFWHMTNGTNSNGWTDLNSCFVHYVSVAKLFGLLSDKDMEPMQPLIDIWVGNGSIPPDAANGACSVSNPQ